VKPFVAASPDWMERELDKIGAELEQRVRFVYPNRERDWTMDQVYERTKDVQDAEPEVTQEVTTVR
jgi:hypothetical protein